jgi:hypothetical protein
LDPLEQSSWSIIANKSSSNGSFSVKSNVNLKKLILTFLELVYATRR